jgi:hypothetical protein
MRTPLHHILTAGATERDYAFNFTGPPQYAKLHSG